MLAVGLATTFLSTAAASPLTPPIEPAGQPGYYPSLPPESPVAGVPAEETVNSTDGRSTAPDGDRVPGAYIVIFQDSVGNLEKVAKAQVKERGGKLGFVYRSILGGFSVKGLSRDDVEALRRDPRVESVVPDGRVTGVQGPEEPTGGEVPKDPGPDGEGTEEGEVSGEGEEEGEEGEGSEQVIPAGVERVYGHESEALDIDGIDDARIDVDIAGIDSGIDGEHPDLDVVHQTDCIPPGETGGFVECVENSGQPTVNSHGTVAAGAFGAIDNGIGVVGTAPGARLWSVRVLGNNNSGQWSWVLGGIAWVVATRQDEDPENDIEVAHLNVAGGLFPPVNTAIAEAVEEGIVVVGAAGNNRINTRAISPASSPDMITTSGLADYDGKPGGEGGTGCGQGTDDQPYLWTNWGEHIDITAVATCVHSTKIGGYEISASGTSFSGPYVAGAAGVLASESEPAGKEDVEALRQELIDGGSLNWTDAWNDGQIEPILYMGDASLTTEVATGAADLIKPGNATLRGAVNARGLETDYYFEYGTSTEYGQVASEPSKTLETGTGHADVTEEISGLKPGKTYHYRLVAVNSGGTIYGKDQTFEAPWWQVEDLTEVPGSTVPLFDWMQRIACSSPEFCMATGTYYNGANRISSYRLSGGEWTFEEIPRTGSYSQPNGLDCPSVTSCIGVNTLTVGGSIRPHALHWDGSKWSPVVIDPPYEGAPYTSPQDVSCVSASECIAVGYSKNSEEKFLNYALQLKGGSWTTLEIPSHEGATQSLLSSVSCASSKFCVAVGWAATPSGDKPVIVKWDGSSWSLEETARSSGVLTGVSCTSTTFCMATGGWTSAEIWDGTEWSELPLDQLKGNWIAPVSCVSPSKCTALGGYESEFYRPLPATWRWNGNAWSVEYLGYASEEFHELRDISCGQWGCATTGFVPHVSSSFDSLIEVRRDLEVETLGSSDVSSSQGDLHGEIDTKGLETAYYFEYGATTAYGNKAPAEPKTLEAGSGVVEVQETIEGLDSHTTYHYRLVAQNDKGTGYGEDKTFTTQPTYIGAFSSSGSSDGKTSNARGIAVEADGDVWVADSNNDRMQKFNSKGEYAGKFGTSGKEPGQLDGPEDVAIDAGGNLWVADYNNARVQKFSTAGTLLDSFGSYGTGNGQFKGPNGVAISPDGHIWVSDNFGWVQEFDAAGDFVQKISGGVPLGIAADAEGGIWVVSSSGSTEKVRKIDPEAGAYVSEFGSEGSGNGQFQDLSAIEVMPSGNILTAERYGSRIQEFTPAGQYVTQFGNWPQVGARWGVAAGPSGEIYASDRYNQNLRKWCGSLHVITASTLPASGIDSDSALVKGSFNRHCQLAIDYQFEYVDDAAFKKGGWESASKAPAEPKTIEAGSGVVEVQETIEGLDPHTTYHYRLVAQNDKGTGYGEDKTFTTQPTYIGAFSSSGSSDGKTSNARGLAVEADGELWVADSNNDRMQKFDSTGKYVSKFGTSGSGAGQLDGPEDVAIDASGNLWVADYNNARVQKFSTAGTLLDSFGSYGTGNGQFKGPNGVAISPDGHVWVSDNFGWVQEFNAEGDFVQKISGGWPMGIAADSGGGIWVVSSSGSTEKVRKIDPKTGKYVSEFGSEGSGNGQFQDLSAIEVMPSGNILTAERYGSRIQEFTPAGEYVTQFGNWPQVGARWGVAAGPGGAIYASDRYNQNLRKWCVSPTPAASSQAASGVSDSKATLNGSAIPYCSPTTYQFEYGTTTAYGSKVPASPKSIGLGTGGVAVSEKAEGLKAHTTYHYRVVATNAQGTTYGEDKTFTTQPTYIGAFSSSGSSDGKTSNARGLAVEADGDVWVADSNNDRMQRFNSKGEYAGKFGTSGKEPGQLDGPEDVAIDAGGNLWVADYNNARVQKFSTAGTLLDSFGSYGTANGQFKGPNGVAISPDGHVWVSDGFGWVQEFDAAGDFVQKISGGAPWGIAADSEGGIWVASSSGSTEKVRKIDPKAGEYVSEFGSYGNDPGEFEQLRAIEVMPSGNILTAEAFSSRSQEFTPAGQYVTQFGNWPQVGARWGVAAGPSGEIYASDRYNQNLRKWQGN